MIIRHPNLKEAIKKQSQYVIKSMSIFEVLFVPFGIILFYFQLLNETKIPEQYLWIIVLVSFPIVALLFLGAIRVGKMLAARTRLARYEMKRKRTPVDQRIKEIRFTDKLECIGDAVEQLYSYHDLSKIIISGGTMVFLINRSPLFILDPSEFTNFTSEDIIQRVRTHNPDIKVLYSGKFWRQTVHY